MRLNTLHNVHFYLSFMQQIRDALENGTFDALRRQLVSTWAVAEAETPESEG